MTWTSIDAVVIYKYFALKSSKPIRSFVFRTQNKQVDCYNDQQKLRPWWRHQIHFLRYWLFVRGIHRSPMNSLHKGQWRGALMFFLSSPWCFWCFLSSPWIIVWVNNHEAGELRRRCVHYDVIVMIFLKSVNAAVWTIWLVKFVLQSHFTWLLIFWVPFGEPKHDCF